MVGVGMRRVDLLAGLAVDMQERGGGRAAARTVG